MSIEVLYPLITEAIRRAETLEDLHAPGAVSAYLDLSLLEERAAEILPASDPEGALARRGAVRAALAAKELTRAQQLAERFLAEAGTDDDLRAELQGFAEQAERSIAARYRHVAARFGLAEIRRLARALIQQARRIQVGLAASAALFLGAIVIVRSLWPCQLLVFPWHWLPVPTGSGLILASAVSLIHRSPGSLNLAILGIIASLLGVVLSLQPPDPETCPDCLEIRKIHGIDAGSVGAESPAQVPCEFRVTGLMRRSGDIYLFTRQISGTVGWVRTRGSGGGAVESNPNTYEWSAVVDLCDADVGTPYELVARAVAPDQLPPEHPRHAECISTSSEFIEVLRLAPGMPSASVVFYVGDRQRHLERIASLVVGANVFYQGFAEPVAWIDWGDGMGWQRAPSKPGEIDFLMNTYEQPGEKEIKFRVVEANSDLSIEKSARIIVVRAALPNQSAP